MNIFIPHWIVNALCYSFFICVALTSFSFLTYGMYAIIKRRLRLAHLIWAVKVYIHIKLLKKPITDELESVMMIAVKEFAKGNERRTEIIANILGLKKG